MTQIQHTMIRLRSPCPNCVVVTHLIVLKYWWQLLQHIHMPIVIGGYSAQMSDKVMEELFLSSIALFVEFACGVGMWAGVGAGRLDWFRVSVLLSLISSGLFPGVDDAFRPTGIASVFCSDIWQVARKLPKLSKASMGIFVSSLLAGVVTIHYQRPLDGVIQRIMHQHHVHLQLRIIPCQEFSPPTLHNPSQTCMMYPFFCSGVVKHTISAWLYLNLTPLPLCLLAPFWTCQLYLLSYHFHLTFKFITSLPSYLKAYHLFHLTTFKLITSLPSYLKAYHLFHLTTFKLITSLPSYLRAYHLFHLTTFKLIRSPPSYLQAYHISSILP